MKSIIALALALVLAGSAHARPVPAEFRQVIENADAAWNKRDLRQLLQFYSPDATLSIAAMQLKGARDIQAYMQTTLDSLPRNIMRRTIIRRIEPVGELILVDTEILMERPGADGKPELLRTIAGFNVVRKEGKGVKILAVRLIPMNKE